MISFLLKQQTLVGERQITDPLPLNKPESAFPMALIKT